LCYSLTKFGHTDGCTLWLVAHRFATPVDTTQLFS
jgi:hypothetical protein